MPIPKNQMKRLVHLTAELKKNRYPNCSSFVKLLKKNNLLDGQACSTKTIQRDIDVLKNEYGAPIEYDYVNKGFHLKHDGWNLQCPVVSEDEMLAMVCGVEVAERVFPEPLRSKMRDAVDWQLSENSLGLDTDRDYLDALKICSDLNVKIDPTLFMTLFNSWRKAERVEIEYRDVKGEMSKRSIDPHVLAFRDRAWYVCAYCHTRNEFRNFALHRIKSVAPIAEFFKRNVEAIHKVEEQGLFVYETINDIRLECAPEALAVVSDMPWHPDQKVIPATKKGWAVVRIPSANEDEIIRWILSYAGLIRVVSPKRLRLKIAEKAKALLDEHSD